MRKIRFGMVLAVASLALFAAACGGDDAEEAGGGNAGTSGEEGGAADDAGGDLPTVTMQAIEGSVGGLPLMLMEAEGLDEKYGFDGDFQFLPHEGAWQNFLQGNSDVAVDNDIIGTAISRTEGFDVRAFYPVGNLYVGIIVPEDSPAQDPTDLIGQKVGYFGMDAGATNFLRVLLQEQYDIDITTDYELVQLEPPALVEVLAAGDIAAMFNFEAFTSRAVAEVPARWLLQAHEAYQEAFDGFAPWITNMVASAEWLEDNPELAYAVRDAYDEALQMLEDSDYQIVNDPTYMEQLGVEDQAVMDLLVENAATTPYFTNDWSPETIARAEEFLGMLADQDLLIEEVPEGVMVTLEDFIGPRPS